MNMIPVLDRHKQKYLNKIQNIAVIYYITSLLYCYFEMELFVRIVFIYYYLLNYDFFILI